MSDVTLSVSTCHSRISIKNINDNVYRLTEPCTQFFLHTTKARDGLWPCEHDREDQRWTRSLIVWTVCLRASNSRRTTRRGYCTAPCARILPLQDSRSPTWRCPLRQHMTWWLRPRAVRRASHNVHHFRNHHQCHHLLYRHFLLHYHQHYQRSQHYHHHQTDHHRHNQHSHQLSSRQQHPRKHSLAWLTSAQ